MANNQGTTNQLFVIDSATPDIEALIAGLPPGAEYLILAAGEGLEELAGQLADYQQLEAIHLLSHGKEGALVLGKETLTSESLPQYQKAMAAIGDRLTENGDILLYGCEVAAGDVGKSFIEELARWTKADIAASENLTGSDQLNGDWILEASIGQVETPTFSMSDDYNHRLTLDGATVEQVELATSTVVVDSDDDLTGASATYDVEFNLSGGVENLYADIDAGQITIAGRNGTSISIDEINFNFSGGSLDQITAVTLNSAESTADSLEGTVTASFTSNSITLEGLNGAVFSNTTTVQSIVFDITTTTTSSAPTIANATYNASTGALVVTGTDFTATAGAANDVDASRFTLTGEGGETYTLTDTADVEIDSATQFTLSLSATDKAAINQILNKDGTNATDGTAFDLDGAAGFIADSAATADTDANGVTVSNVAAPTISSATYDYSTNTLVVTGTGFLKASGAANDIDVSKLTFTGEGGATYTLTSASDVEITDGTSFSVTLSGADISAVESLLNKDGTTSASSATTYNLAAAEDWAAGADAAVTVADTTGNGVTVSNYTPPTLTSATFDWNSGQLVLTGTNFVSATGPNNDIDVSTLEIFGEDGVSYALTSTDVDITSATQATVALNTTDLLHVRGLLNKNGTTSDDNTTYNLAAQDNWMTGAPASNDIADATGNAITVSNVSLPTITAATYDSDSGVLTVTGTNFVHRTGAANDVDISTITLTGEGGAYTLTSASDVEISSDTSFTLTLSGADKTNVDGLLDQAGNTSSGGTTYNIALADNWLTGAASSPDIADTTGNGVTVQVAPSIATASYNATAGTLVVTGANIQANGGGADIDASAFTLSGEGGATHTLTDTSDVERTSISGFTLNLSAADQAAVAQILNKDGTTSTGGSTFNLSAADDWNTNVLFGDTSDLSNPVTVSNVPVPTLVSATYDASTGTLAVTGTHLSKRDGSADIDASMLTLTGEGGITHTLSDTSDVEITSDTSFTLTLSAADREALGLILNSAGTAATGGTTYNLAAAEDWALGADAAVTIADLTGNGITVSNVQTPTITSATYHGPTGVLTVTGTNFVQLSGANNDINVSQLSIVGEGGQSRALTSGSVDITSATSFSVTLNTADRTALATLINKDGTAATDNTSYNLVANEDWAAGAAAAVTVADLSGNGITATLNTAPTASDTVESVPYNGGYTFTAADFGFSDADGDTLSHITVKTLPTAGSLMLNGTAITVADTDISLAQLNAGELVFRPASGGSGTGYASFDFTVNDGSEDSVNSHTVTLNVGNPPPPPPPPPTPDPEPEPNPEPDPDPEPDPEPDTDGDGISQEEEADVPSLNGDGVGDGNGDGIADSEQGNVASLIFLESDRAESDPDGVPEIYLTLAAVSAESALKDLVQLNAPEDRPDDLEMPLGLLSFGAELEQGSDSATFELYLNGDLNINGYWKQDSDGDWVNLASEAYGGSVSQVNDRLLLTFTIEDGGQFDDDGQVNGVITDPGAPGFRAPEPEPEPEPPTPPGAFDGLPMDTYFDWFNLG